MKIDRVAHATTLCIGSTFSWLCIPPGCAPVEISKLPELTGVQSHLLRLSTADAGPNPESLLLLPELDKEGVPASVVDGEFVCLARSVGRSDGALTMLFLVSSLWLDA